MLGLPKLLKEEDIHCEYPCDTDDEYVTEKGFQPSLPGEATRLSNALALFRCSRILSKILEKIYPSAPTAELSLQLMDSLEAELNEWYEKLPPHLKLNFKQDKPSTDVTGSRSPILVSCGSLLGSRLHCTNLAFIQALAYYYCHTLIFRPAVTSTLGTKAAPALLKVSEAAKHMIQIMELLEERNMSFSFCLNKGDLLMLCGTVLLFQTMDLKQDSKVLRDNEKLINSVIKAADRQKAPGIYDFKRVAGLMITVDEPPPQSLPTPPRQSPDTCLSAPQQRASPTAAHKAHPTLGRHLSASVSETDLLMQQEKLRRMTMPHHPQAAAHIPQRPRGSFDSTRPTIPLTQRDHRLSLSQPHVSQAAPMLGRLPTSPGANIKPDVEYHLPIHGSSHSQPSSPVQTRGPAPHPSMTPAQQAHLYAQLQKGSNASGAEWEALLGSLDGGQLNVYDAIYGGPSLALAETPVSTTPTSTTATTASTAAWSPESWDLSSFNLGDFNSGSGSSHSVVSMSEDGLSSSEDLVSMGSMDFRNTILPTTAECAVAGSVPAVAPAPEGFHVLDPMHSGFPL